MRTDPGITENVIPANFQFVRKVQRFASFADLEEIHFIETRIHATILTTKLSGVFLMTKIVPYVILVACANQRNGAYSMRLHIIVGKINSPSPPINKFKNKQTIVELSLMNRPKTFV